MPKSFGEVGAKIMLVNEVISTFILTSAWIFRHRKAHAMCELYSFY